MIRYVGLFLGAERDEEERPNSKGVECRKIESCLEKAMQPRPTISIEEAIKCYINIEKCGITFSVLGNLEVFRRKDDGDDGGISFKIGEDVDDRCWVVGVFSSTGCFSRTGWIQNSGNN
jgi:hypothetical protein